jgi:predicted glycogen debranching enzyme
MQLPKITINSNVLARFEESTHKEWLVTNGIGGYAATTVLGLNTRKYHGYLVASLHPPGDRTVCLSKLDEDIFLDGKIYRLGVNEFHNNLFPGGHLLLKQFAINPFPSLTYEIGELTLEKTIGMPYGKNLSLVLYNVENKCNLDAKIRVYPLVTCRHFHTVINHHQSQSIFVVNNECQDVTLSHVHPQATIILRSTAGQFVQKPSWVEGMYYREEAARGESDTEDCYQPGYYEIKLLAGKKTVFGIAAAASEKHEQALTDMMFAGYSTTDFQQILLNRMEFYSKFLERFYEGHRQVSVSDWLNWILLASDSFVVYGALEKRSIIAGYFWFESWGRDTFISLPGLMLVTNRFEDARQTLLNFINYCHKGLIPNLIPDLQGKPLYNTVDGTLWYINAVLQYIKYTGDLEFVERELWTTLKLIIQNHELGTDFGIKIDSDGLISHGAGLTWMDAFVNGKAVTPREGKAVEIQALWYNALMIMQLLAGKFGEKILAKKYLGMAKDAKKSFLVKFWDVDHGYLFDVVQETNVDNSMRPNQIIAASLDFSMLDQSKVKAIVDIVQREFLTPRGLRTLSQSDTQYRGIYDGTVNVRDQAYHNGTVWPWLLGPFVNAYFKAHDHIDQNVDFITGKVFQALFEKQILESGLGSVNEIFDGDPPHQPRGCISQAWSVAEPLRAYIEEVLQIRPKYEHDLFKS